MLVTYWCIISIKVYGNVYIHLILAFVKGLWGEILWHYFKPAQPRMFFLTLVVLPLSGILPPQIEGYQGSVSCPDRRLCLYADAAPPPNDVNASHASVTRRVRLHTSPFFLWSKASRILTPRPCSFGQWWNFTIRPERDRAASWGSHSPLRLHCCHLSPGCSGGLWQEMVLLQSQDPPSTQRITMICHE